MTGKPLTSLTLTPIFLVRQLIAATTTAAPAVAVAAGATAATIPTTVKPFENRLPHVGGRSFTGRNGKRYVQIQASIPYDAPLSATGSDYIFSIDTSGSMDTVAWVKVDKGEMGITRLNLVKHLVKTLLGMLGPEDRVALVTFGSEARARLGLTPVTDAGRTRITWELDRLLVDGSTHLYGGVEEAARIASSDICRGRRIVGMILTDGQPTESIAPVTGGRTTLSVIQERIRVANPWTFHAIGFSSDINSRLLEQLAALWNGRMLFVPSGDMVSTNGINLAAFEKTVVSLGTSIHYTVNEVGYTFEVGPLGIGQRRDFVAEVPPPRSDDPFDQGIRLTIRGGCGPPSELGSIEFADCRHDFVETLTGLIDTVVLKSQWAPLTDFLPDLKKTLLAFYGRHMASEDRGVKAVLRDVVSTADGEGQCLLALQYLGPTEWGLHYLRAYRDHMRAGVCMNFKDPGLKTFETPAFLEFQRQGDAAFGAIPPPPIQRQGAASTAHVTMGSAFHNASGGCFEGSMPVQMWSGYGEPEVWKAVRDIRQGDRVKTMLGPATVEYAIEINTHAPSQPMVQLTPEISVTPWHPMRVSGTCEWMFPAEIAPYSARPLRTVYNLVLDRAHVIHTDACDFVTLGHGYDEDPVLRHDFFGSKARIVAALKRQPGFEEGRPVFTNLMALKEEDRIVDWIDTEISV